MKRFIKVTLLTILILLVTVIAFTATIIFTESGREQAISTAIKQLKKIGIEIELVNFKTPKLGHISADLIKVEQGGNKLVEIKSFDFIWQPSALLNYAVEIENIAATSIIVYHSTPSDTPKVEEPQSSKAPSIPSIHIGNIELNSIKLKDENQDDIIDLNLSGSAQVKSLDKDGINFNITAGDNQSGKTLLTIKTADGQDAKKLYVNYKDTTPLLIDKFTPKSYFEKVELLLEIDIPAEKDNEYSFNFSNSFLKLDNETIGLAGGLAFNHSNNQLKFNDFRLITAGNTEHKINGIFSNDLLDLKISLKDFPLPMLNLFLEQDIEGTASADVILKGSVEKPNAVGNIDIRSKIYLTTLTAISGFSFNENILEIKNLDVDFGKNFLKANGNYNISEQKFDFKLNTSVKTADIPKALLDDAGINLNAALTADIALLGTIDLPSINGAITFTELDHAIKLTSALSTGNGTISAVTKIADQKNTLSNIIVSFPQSMIGNLVNAKEDSSIISANGTAKLESFADLLKLNGQKFSGNLKFDAKVKPTPTPIINANINLSNGTYENSAGGTYLKNITLQLDAVENKFTIRSSMVDRKKGTFNMSGGFALKDNLPADVNIKITGREMNLVARSDADANISTDLTLTGQAENMLLKGNVDIFPLKIYPANINSYSVPEITITKKVKGKPVVTEAEQEESKFNLNLDVTVTADKQASIISKDINAELGGSIKLTGNAKKPLYSGAFNVVRGWMELLGKRFVLKKDSSVKLEEASIYLDLTATHEANDKTFTAHIYGFEDSMKFDFTSDPAMPQDEVLSNLMFEKSSRSISPMQAINLAQTLNSLRGGKKSATPLSNIQNMMSANNITVNQGDEGGMNLGVGRYLTDKVYMEVTADSDSKNGNPVKTRTEIELRSNLNLESETGGSSGVGGASLQWKNDY